MMDSAGVYPNAVAIEGAVRRSFADLRFHPKDENIDVTVVLLRRLNLAA
jgi:hypothetical protein